MQRGIPLPLRLKVGLLTQQAPGPADHIKEPVHLPYMYKPKQIYIYLVRHESSKISSPFLSSRMTYH